MRRAGTRSGRLGAASSRSAVLGLIAAIAIVGLSLSGPAAPGVEAAGGATFTLSPDHGWPWEAFDATYTAPPLPSGACSDFAEITWDGVVLEDTGPGELVAGSCLFTATLRPPSDQAAAGPHDLVGSACVVVSGVGVCDPATATPATYTIDAAAPPSLHLLPGHGLSVAQLGLTYLTPASVYASCGDYAEIAWDGVPIETTGTGTLVGGSCRFTAVATPPADQAAPGPHDLGATSCTADAGVSCDPQSAASATYRIDSTTIDISPATGLPDQSITMTYDMPAGSCSDALEAQFLWYGVDGLEVGRAPFDAACTATLSGVTPPSGAAPGPNVVTALTCFSARSCDTATAPASDATFTVQVPATVALSPATGDAVTPFTATYTQDTIDCGYSDVRFGWDGELIPSWTTTLDSTCSGSMDLTPPPGTAPGDHRVTAEACVGARTGLVCDAWTAPQKVAEYVIPFPPSGGVLNIAKSSGVAQVPAGGRITYTLTVTMFQAASASGVSIVDQLPAGIGQVTAITGGGTYSAATNRITWSGITVSDGQRLTYRAVVSPTASPARSPYVNTARITGGLCEICSASASVIVLPAPAPTPTATPAPRRSPSPSPSGSPTPSVEPTAAPSASPSPTPTATPSGTVEEATGSPEPTREPAGIPAGPGPSAPPGGDPGSVVPPTGATADGSLVSDYVASVPTPAGFAFTPDVVATNLALALLFVFLFGLTSEIFNSTIDEHREEIEGWWERVLRGPLLLLAPVMKLDAAFDDLSERGRLGAVLHGMGIVLVIGLVYGLLSPDFGLDETSLILMASLMIGAGFVTYLNYGGKSLLIQRRHRARSVVRLYGTAVMVAVVCVLATRFIGFHPGIIYGFMASTVILTPIALERRDEARIVLLPAAMLLLVSLVAWLLLIPVDAAGEDPGVGMTLLKSVLTIVFVGGLEGLLFNLIPLRYMDGARVMAWSRIAWALAFGLVTFLWWQLMLNRDRAYADALTQTSVGPVIGALVFFALTTGIVWVFFRVRDQRRPLEGEA